MIILAAAVHCNPNHQEKLDHCSSNDFANDDRSKLDIGVNFSVLLMLLWQEYVNLSRSFKAAEF